MSRLTDVRYFTGTTLDTPPVTGFAGRSVASRAGICAGQRATHDRTTTGRTRSGHRRQRSSTATGAGDGFAPGMVNDEVTAARGPSYPQARRFRRCVRPCRGARPTRSTLLRSWQHFLTRNSARMHGRAPEMAKSTSPEVSRGPWPTNELAISRAALGAFSRRPNRTGIQRSGFAVTGA